MAAPGTPNHQAVVDDSKIEWLQRAKPATVSAMSRRLAIANELGQKDILRYLHTMMRGIAALDEKRAGMVYDIAKNEEAVKVASELTAPRGGV